MNRREAILTKRNVITLAIATVVQVVGSILALKYRIFIPWRVGKFIVVAGLAVVVGSVAYGLTRSRKQG